MLYFGAFHGQMRKNSFAKHNNGSLLIHCLRGLFSLRKPYHDKLGVEVLFLKFRAHPGLLLLLIGARGKRRANVTGKSSASPNWKLKGDFVSFLYGECAHVISAWQCKSGCMVWTVTSNDSSSASSGDMRERNDNDWWQLAVYRFLYKSFSWYSQGTRECCAQQETGPAMPAVLRHTVDHLSGRQLHFFLVSLARLI